jgi:hypothetical protein
MTRINRLACVSERSRERDGKRLSELDADCDPELQRDSAPVAELDPAYPRLVDSNAVGEVGLSEPQAFPARFDALTECDSDLGR